MADVINRPKAKEVLKIRCHTAHHQRGNCIGPAEDPGKRDDRGRMGEGERHTSAIVAPNADHNPRARPPRMRRTGALLADRIDNSLGMTVRQVDALVRRRATRISTMGSFPSSSPHTPSQKCGAETRPSGPLWTTL